MIEIMSREREFMTEKKTLFFVIHCQKIIVKSLPWIIVKENAHTENVKDWKVHDGIFLSKFYCAKLFQ